MSALPTRTDLSGSPSNATAKAALSSQYDFIAQRLAAGTAGAGTATGPELELARTSLQVDRVVQAQTYTAFTTAGTSSAFTLAVTPAAATYVANQAFDVTFHTASSGTPTIAVDAQAAKALMYRNAAGVKVTVGGRLPANWRSKVTYDGTDFIVESLPELVDSTRIDVASATTVDLTTLAPNTRHLNLTGTATITGFTVAAGQSYFVRTAGALTLTNSGTLVTQRGANITTDAGATFFLRAVAANSVEIMYYTPASAIATETNPGIVELASSAEALALTATDRAISPARLKDSFGVTGSAPMFACRAWVNFNGTGTVAIRASGNVSSITDNGTGDYTINFTTAMPDANYAVIPGAFGAGASVVLRNPLSQTTSAVRITHTSSPNVTVSSTPATVGVDYPLGDSAHVHVAIFR